MAEAFLVAERTPQQIFTPEDLSPEQQSIAATAREFVEREVLPRLPQLLVLDHAAIRGALREAGRLGLLGLEIPEAYGGQGLGRIEGCLACGILAREASFAVSVMAHSGLGSWPIVRHGTEEQKRRYLPRIASGEWISCFSLSEAASASDALGIQATATASADGRHWILNGEKMWLTNAGFADLYVTFARTGGGLSAFIVEKQTSGVSLGPEQRKTGLRGSSTRALVLSDARVPRENLLGRVGQGFAIALSALNLGRLKLAASTAAGCRHVFEAALGHATTRTAFGRPLAELGLIRHKLAEMAILAYVGEAMVYRTAGLIDHGLERAAGRPAEEAASIEDDDGPCSLVKIWCSEALDWVVDENVQIFGAAGYVEDHAAERYWRDARINRIFEGTNEINRLQLANRLLRQALRGELPLPGEGSAPPDGLPARAPEGFLAEEARLLAGAKKAALLCLAAITRRRGETLAEEQEVLGHLADVALDVYALESALLRARKRALARGEAQARLQLAALRCFAQQAGERIANAARRLLSAVQEGAALRGSQAALEHLTRLRPVNTVALRRQLALAAVEKAGDPLV